MHDERSQRISYHLAGLAQRGCGLALRSLLALSAGLAITPTPAIALGPRPPAQTSPCATFTVSPVIVADGQYQTVTLSTHPGACGGSASEGYQYGRCGYTQPTAPTTCRTRYRVRLPDHDNRRAQWLRLCTYGDSTNGPWEVCLSYGVVPAGQRIPRTFTAEGPQGTAQGVSVGDRITFHGTYWRRGPVRIYYGRKLVAHVRGPSFSGSIKLPDWTDSNCQQTLRAVQGSDERVLLAGAHRALVTYANHAALGRRRLKPGAFICAGETLPQLHVNGGLLARTLLPNGGITPSPEDDPVPVSAVSGFDEQQFVFAGQLLAARHLLIPGGVFAGQVTINGVNVQAISAAAVGLPSIAQTLGQSATPIAGQGNEGIFSGRLRSDGNLDLQGAKIKCDGAAFFVDASATISGPLSGGCSFIAGTSLTFAGGMTDLTGAVRQNEYSNGYWTAVAPHIVVR